MTTTTIVIKAGYVADERIPESDRYVAWIDGDKHKGFVVAGASIGECVKELGVSLRVMELYEEQKIKNKK